MPVSYCSGLLGLTQSIINLLNHQNFFIAKLQRVPRPPVPSQVYVMPSGSLSRLQAAKLSLPCLCASLQLCPGSSGVWLRRAEKTVLGAGG